MDKSFDLYFFEVNTGIQSFGFHPTHYIDISSVQEQKRKAVYCHKSQDPDHIYERHGLMEKFRGSELNVKAAEGFVRMTKASPYSFFFQENKK
jgi:LmbE family N-acetylglucosaminyl deacetylase